MTSIDEHNEMTSVAEDKNCQYGQEMENDDYDNEIYSEDDENDYCYQIEENDARTMMKDTNASMDWDPSENPNTAPMNGRKGDGIRVLPCDELLPEMKRRLTDITEVLDVPTSAARVLLEAHGWSKELLMERYCNDSEALLQECGVYFRCFPVTKKAAPKTRSLSVSCCPICYDDGVTMWNMPCGHDFCQGCAHDFCANAIQEGPACVRTTCPEAKCTEVIAEEEVALAAPELLPKYQSFQLRSFVDSNPLTRWCPGKGCERVACASSAVALEKVQNVARCDACMTSFCVICGDEPHEPSGCKIVQQWKGRCQGESTGCKNLQKWKDNRRKDFKSSNWVLSNTKGCPSCLVRIEKNDGCDHMTCTQCRHEFCWICKQTWATHGYSRCLVSNNATPAAQELDPNLHNEDMSDDEDSGLTSNGIEPTDDEAMTDLFQNFLIYGHRSDHGDFCSILNDEDDAVDAAQKKRDVYYHKRYHAHAEAQEFAEKQLSLLEDPPENVKWTDVELLKTANEQLVECRRVLKHTYVFAYYTTGMQAIQREMFEHGQETLERLTEDLSELLLNPLTETNRMDVFNKTRVLDHFKKSFLQYVADGMDDI